MNPRRNGTILLYLTALSVYEVRATGHQRATETATPDGDRHPSSLM
jgi:hypothetical protein